jgi:hypothetical protein
MSSQQHKIEAHARSMESRVGEVFGESRIIRVLPGDGEHRPRFRMRCVAAGHEYPRATWDVLNGRSTTCPHCQGGKAASRAAEDENGRGTPREIRELLKEPPRVCSCTYYGGRLVRTCRYHQEPTK